MKDTLAGVSASLESPTMVSAGGSSPVMAIIEHLEAARCRMRSVNPFDIGAHVEFNAVIHGVAPIPLRGAIRSRTQKGPRYVYAVDLEFNPGIASAIEHAVDVAKTRTVRISTDVQTNNGLTRAAVRVPVDFVLRFTIDGDRRAARATNISTGGILMNSGAELAVGSSLDLEFLLDDVPVSVRGRIVAHQESTPNYNIAFYDVRENVRETLARFIDGVSK
jgi:hypothetical protein